MFSCIWNHYPTFACLLTFRSFADSICEKLSQIMEGLATPYDTKLKVIPIFQHMHHDTQKTTQVGLHSTRQRLVGYNPEFYRIVLQTPISSIGALCFQVRELCLKLLPSYPSRGFVLVTLRMLSQLAAKSLIDIPVQVDNKCLSLWNFSAISYWCLSLWFFSPISYWWITSFWSTIEQ